MSGVVWSRVVFLFKQKTADDMLISDWSSDVGSSDLAALEVRTDHVRGLFCRQQGEARQRREVGEHAHRLRHACDARLPPQSPQIARASSRARGCQYV